MGLVIQVPISGQTTIGGLTAALLTQSPTEGNPPSRLSAKFEKICTNIHGSVVIRMAFIPTLLAPKLSLRRAIPSLNVSALAAFLTRVARVNKTNVRTSRFGFVSDECLELSKAPSMQPAALGSVAKFLK